MLVVPLPSATEVVLLKVVVVVVATVGIGRAVGAVDADEVGTALGSHGGGSGAAAGGVVMAVSTKHLTPSTRFAQCEAVRIVGNARNCTRTFALLYLQTRQHYPSNLSLALDFHSRLSDQFGHNMLL